MKRAFIALFVLALSVIEAGAQALPTGCSPDPASPPVVVNGTQYQTKAICSVPITGVSDGLAHQVGVYAMGTDGQVAGPILLNFAAAVQLEWQDPAWDIPSNTARFKVTAPQGIKSIEITRDGQVAAAASDPAVIVLKWEGKVRDRVGRGDLAFAADGAMDATLTATYHGSTRTITQLMLRNSLGGAWDTVVSGDWALGVASGLDSPLINNPTTGAVNLTVTDGATFTVFAADPNAFFVSSVGLTLFVSFSDGTTSQMAVVIP